MPIEFWQRLARERSDQPVVVPKEYPDGGIHDVINNQSTEIIEVYRGLIIGDIHDLDLDYNFRLGADGKPTTYASDYVMMRRWTAIDSAGRNGGIVITYRLPAALIKPRSNLIGQIEMKTLQRFGIKSAAYFVTKIEWF